MSKIRTECFTANRILDAMARACEMVRDGVQFTYRPMIENGVLIECEISYPAEAERARRGQQEPKKNPA